MHPDEPYSETPATMPVWWGLWIVTSIAGNISMRMSIEAGLFGEYASDVPLYKTTLYIDLFSAVTGIIAAWLILGILRSIAEAQDMRIQADAFD